MGETKTAEFFWNYNTVESVLLFCSVMVCLLGVMFDSQDESGQGEQAYFVEALGNLTLAIVISSLVYYCVVVWCEVVGVLCPALACSFLNGTVADEHAEDLKSEITKHKRELNEAKLAA